MELEIIIGVILIATALGVIVFLVIWSQGIIKRIYSKSPKILREIKKEINNE